MTRKVLPEFCESEVTHQYVIQDWADPQSARRGVTSRRLENPVPGTPIETRPRLYPEPRSIWFELLPDFPLPVESVAPDRIVPVEDIGGVVDD